MSRTAPAGMAGDTDSAMRSAEAVLELLSSLVHHGPRDMSLTSRATLTTLQRTGPRRVTDLATIQGVTQPSMTTLVTVLERTGLVERRSDPDDKRVVLVALTPAGSEHVHARRRANVEVFQELIRKLPADEAAALAAAIPALHRLRELDDEQRDPGPGQLGV